MAAGPGPSETLLVSCIGDTHSVPTKGLMQGEKMTWDADSCQPPFFDAGGCLFDHHRSSNNPFKNRMERSY